MIEVRYADQKDIPRLVEIVKKLDERGIFYHNRRGTTEKLFKESFYKENLDSILVAEEVEIVSPLVPYYPSVPAVLKQVIGFSIWFKEDGVIYNYWTLVDPDHQRKGAAKMMYEFFLKERPQHRTEFITTPYAYKLIAFWSKYGTLPMGFAPLPKLYNSKGEFFGEIIGGKINGKRDKLIVPKYAVRFIEYIAKLQNSEVKIIPTDSQPEDTDPFELYDWEVTRDASNTKYYVTGYIPGKGLIISTIDDKILNQIEEIVNKVGGIWKEAYDMFHSTILRR